MNVKDLAMSTEMKSFISLSAVAKSKALGPRLKGQASAVCDFISKLSHDAVSDLLKVGFVDVMGHRIERCDVDIQYNFIGDAETYVSATSTSGSMLAVVNKKLTKECELEGIAREFMSRVQKLRKSANVSYEHKVAVYFEKVGEPVKLLHAMAELRDFIHQGLRIDVFAYEEKIESGSILMTEVAEIFDEKVNLLLVRL